MPAKKSCHGSPAAAHSAFLKFSFFQSEVEQKTAAAWTDGSCKGSVAGRPGILCLAGSTAGRGDETMTINPFDLTAIAGFMAVGLWLETVGSKDGFVDEFFAPIPLAATGCIYAVLRSLIY
jgi:hypothetical protein